MYQFHNAEFNDQWINEHPGLVENFIVDERDREEFQMEEQNQAHVQEDDWEEDTDDVPVNPGAEITLLQDMNEDVAYDQSRAIQYAPGEGNRPIGLLSDEDAEWLAWLINYGGQRPELPPRTTYAAQVKYEIRHVDRRFAESTDHLLFKTMKLMIHKVNNGVQFAMRQVHCGTMQVTVSDMLNDGFVDELARYDIGK